MRKKRMIYVGDYKQEYCRNMLALIYTSYAEEYDILATGYNLNEIKNSAEAFPMKIVGLGSSEHTFFKNTASAVIVTTEISHYRKTKRNQQIIFMVPSYDPKTFNGIYGDISCLITFSSENIEYVKNTYPNITILQVAGKDESIIALMAYFSKQHRENNPVDYLVITADGNADFLLEGSAVRHYFQDLIDVSDNNVFLLSAGKYGDCFSSFFSLSKDDRTVNFLRSYEGIVVYDNEVSEVFFKRFIQEQEISCAFEKEMYFTDLKLSLLKRRAEKHHLALPSDSLSDYQQFRYLSDMLYENSECKNIKVSIIICRYNTPHDLLFRAIDSALNCGHENVEVLVIDDGSEDNIQDIIEEHFHDQRVCYYYKENEGLGLSRDYGIHKSSGEYVFYLDSDDVLHKNGIKYMLSHAMTYHLDMVIGKRVLCDEDGVPINESLKYLTGDTFTAYYSNRPSNIYIDVMVNNKLIRRDFLIKNNIHFNRGRYEDVEYSPRLYSTIPEYHYVNIAVHDWYQYGDNTTISSTIDLRSLEERIQKEEIAWKYTPEHTRRSRIGTILTADFNRFYTGFRSLSGEDQKQAWNKIKAFFQTKADYFQDGIYAESTSELVNAIRTDSYLFFCETLNKYYADEKKEDAYDDYIIITHYHLYVSCLYAAASGRKSRLYIYRDYAKFTDSLVARVRESGLFEKVVLFSNDNTVSSLFEELEKRPEEADTIIPTFLYPKFRNIFRGCNPLEDTVYIFSDTHPYWYYIERCFKHIIKLEDAYNSFDREVKSFKLYGIWAGIEKYAGTVFPEINFKSARIEKIIVSSWPEDIPSFYYDKIEVLDTKELNIKHYARMKDIMLSIYEIDASQFKSDSVLLLTQPLALFNYCTKGEQKELYRTMCKDINKERLLIKPHPGDKMNYRFLGGTILPKDVPMEMYNYLDVSIQQVVSFGSSANETLTIARDSKTYFKLHGFTHDEVVTAIKDMIKKPVYIRALRKVKRILS